MRRVPEEAVFDTARIFRTVGGRFRYRISLPYRRSLFFTPNASENASRTPEACFEHGTHIPYCRSLFPVPSAFEGVGKGAAGDKFRVSEGRRKWWKGPGRTKRAKSSQRQAAAMLFTLPPGVFVPNVCPESGTWYYKKKKVNCES